MSANTLMQVTGVSGKQYKKVRWHDRELSIRQMLSVEEYVQTVQNILKDCSDGNQALVPELADFAIRKNIVSSYAFIDLPEDINNMYYVLYASDVYDLVCSVGNEDQIESIIRSVMLYMK